MSCQCSDCSLDSDHKIENVMLKTANEALRERRRFELTCAALTGLAAYKGAMCAAEAVRLADETIAALEAKPASNG